MVSTRLAWVVLEIVTFLLSQFNFFLSEILQERSNVLFRAGNVFVHAVLCELFRQDRQDRHDRHSF